MADFDGSRLSLARRLRRFSRTALASQIEVSAAAVTQFEKGDARPTIAVVAALGQALNVPTEFFSRGLPVQLLPSGDAHFRSLRATPAISRDQALAFAELTIAVAALLEQYVDFPEPALPLHPVDDPTIEEVEAVAAETRSALGVAAGPVPHMVRLLETHGTLVVRLPADVDRRVDAFSTSVQGRPLVLLSEAKNDKARSRFDSAHELGHLVMHPDAEPGAKPVEDQAQTFASEFLAPRDQILPELPRRPDWAELQRLKARWGMSMSALVYKAHRYEVWGDATYRRAMQTLRIQGYPEPGPLGPSEQPSLLGAALELVEATGVSVDSIAEMGRIPVASVREVITSATATRPKVEIRPL